MRDHLRRQVALEQKKSKEAQKLLGEHSEGQQFVLPSSYNTGAAVFVEGNYNIDLQSHNGSDEIEEDQNLD